MLIIEKMEETAFSATEKELINYILEQKYDIKDKTTKQISVETATNPSMLVRIAKKLGFHGWVELKEAFLEEVRYLESNFESIDANLPFSGTDNYMTIAGKLAQLHQFTISDSLSLLQYENLSKAVQIIAKAENIKIFTHNENGLVAQDFAFRMNRIQKYTTICPIESELIYEAMSCNPNSCAIIISYTGENCAISQMVSILKKRKIPIIAITSIGQGSLSTQADCTLRITTRERLYSKVAGFTVMISISYLLDVLYSCVFALDYERNLEQKIKISRLTDRRKTTSRIMEETDI